MINSGIETPCVMIDEAVAERNVAVVQQQFDALGIALRPHIKTHKLIHFARKQLAAGAVGITCQKTTEALPFVEQGCTDVLITYNILGAEKLERLRSLARRAKLTVVADSRTVIAGLAKAFESAETQLRVLVECDTGLGRCGVQAPEHAAELALVIAQNQGLTFGGLMTYPAPQSHERVEEFMLKAKALCENAVGSCATISSGGTPSMKSVPGGSVVTEYRPGTYIYNDRSLVSRGACTLEDCALFVAATVVSRPTRDRAILDAGSKTLSSDLMGQTGYGMLRDYPEAVITGLSEEHGHVDLSACHRRPEVGEVVAILPNHACVVTNLFNRVHLHRGGTDVRTMQVDARGCVL